MCAFAAQDGHAGTGDASGAEYITLEAMFEIELSGTQAEWSSTTLLVNLVEIFRERALLVGMVLGFALSHSAVDVVLVTSACGASAMSGMRLLWCRASADVP